MWCEKSDAQRLLSICDPDMAKMENHQIFNRRYIFIYGYVSIFMFVLMGVLVLNMRISQPKIMNTSSPTLVNPWSLNFSPLGVDLLLMGFWNPRGLSIRPYPRGVFVEILSQREYGFLKLLFFLQVNSHQYMRYRFEMIWEYHWENGGGPQIVGIYWVPIPF